MPLAASRRRASWRSSSSLLGRCCIYNCLSYVFHILPFCWSATLGRYVSVSQRRQRYQQFLDRVTPHVTGRWIAAVVSLVLFMLRIISLQVSQHQHFAGGVWLASPGLVHSDVWPRNLSAQLVYRLLDASFWSRARGIGGFACFLAHLVGTFGCFRGR